MTRTTLRSLPLVCLVLIAGCQNFVPNAGQTPQQQLLVLSNDYNLALAAVNVGLQTGVLTKAEVAAATPYFNAVDAALNSATADAAANTPALQADLNAALAAYQQLAPIFQKAKAAKVPSPVTTKPS